MTQCRSKIQGYEIRKHSQRKPAPMSYGLEGAHLEQQFQQPIGRRHPKECRSFPKGETVRLSYLEKEHSRHDLSWEMAVTLSPRSALASPLFAQGFPAWKRHTAISPAQSSHFHQSHKARYLVALSGAPGSGRTKIASHLHQHRSGPCEQEACEEACRC